MKLSASAAMVLCCLITSVTSITLSLLNRGTIAAHHHDQQATNAVVQTRSERHEAALEALKASAIIIPPTGYVFQGLTNIIPVGMMDVVKPTGGQQ